MANDETTLDLTPDTEATTTDATETPAEEAQGEDDGEADEEPDDGSSGGSEAPAPPGATDPVSEPPADTLIAAAVVPPPAATATAPAADVTDGGSQGEVTPVVTVGRIVHVALDRGPATGDCRPAIVVRVWNPEMINAQLFSDGLNDHTDYAAGIVWKTSLRYHKPAPGIETPPNTWHWSWED